MNRTVRKIFRLRLVESFAFLTQWVDGDCAEAFRADGGFKLLRDRILGVIVVPFRHHDVHFAGLAGYQFDVQWIRVKIHLATVRFVDGYGRHLAKDLHLYTLAVDELNARHDRVKDDGRLAAGVHDDGVDFPFDRQSTVLASEHVHEVVHLDVVDEQFLVALVILHEPLFTIFGENWWLVDR